ncbi:MAG: DUF4855 domain-containing protein, partial [Bacteroidales bacterium]|nr:DUF4855 domain-containing protein [Bacteroidales bacterium]
AYKLYDYMNVFKDQGIRDNYYMAYYQGSWTVKHLKDSADPRDYNTFQDFCDWVAKRPFRDKIN